MGKWPEVRLGEVLHRKEISTIPTVGETYKEITVRLWGKGVLLRRDVDGSELAGSRRFLANAGDLIISRIDARHGANGIVPPELDKAVVTQDFPLFTVGPSILVGYMGWFCKTAQFVEMCIQASEGTTNRVRLSEQKFLNLTIPLPSLEEQRRIVALIDTADARIQEMQRLKKSMQSDAEKLLLSMLEDSGSCSEVPLSDLLELRAPDVTVKADETYHFAGVYSFGRGVFPSVTKSGLEFAYPRLTTLHQGNFVYPKLMAWEGALGVVPPSCHGLVVSTEFPVFSVRTDLVLPVVLETYFKNPRVWPLLVKSSKGTNQRRRRVSPSEFLKHEIPLPRMKTQKTMLAVQTRLNEALRPQEQDLDTLLPSLLDRAFRGEL